MKTRTRVVLLLAVALVAAWWAARHFAGREVDDDTVVRVSGNIEITDAEVSFKIPGRLEMRAVSEGELVRAGQVVARLETNELAHEAALRRAEVAAAQAFLAELEAGTRPEEITQAEAALALAEAEAAQARLEYARQRDLRAQAVNTPRDLEGADTALKAAEARVREAQARWTLLKHGPRREQIEQARARVDQAKQALALAETRLSEATLLSPLTGVVLAKHIEPGEYVAPGTPVVTVGDLEHPWLRAYIHETDLGRVKLGQTVTVTTDTYPDKTYEGRITFISAQAEFTPKNVQTRQERVKLVYRIKVELPNPRQELKPGMPAEATIHLQAPTASHGRHSR